MQDNKTNYPKQPFMYIIWGNLSRTFYHLTHNSWIDAVQKYLDQKASTYMVNDLKKFL